MDWLQANKAGIDVLFAASTLFTVMVVIYLIPCQLDFLSPLWVFEEHVNFTNTFFRQNGLRLLHGNLSDCDVQGRPYELLTELNLKAYDRQSQIIRKDIGDLIKVVKSNQRQIERNP